MITGNDVKDVINSFSFPYIAEGERLGSNGGWENNLYNKMNSLDGIIHSAQCKCMHRMYFGTTYVK